MKLIFTDIDGTLAIGKEVPASAEEAIRRCREKGDLVFVCTGRNITYVKNNFSEYADGFITNNGRLVYYNDKIIYAKPLKEEEFDKILGQLKDLNVGAVFHGKDRGYYIGPEDLYETIKIVSDPGYMSIGLKEDEEYYNFDLCYYELSQVPQIMEAFEEFCIVNPHDPHPSADMTVVGSDKGDAIKAAAGILQVDIEDVYAFGDGYNDICMFKAAGHSVAMGNAVKEAKEAAEYVTDDINNDGLAKGLQHFGL